MIKGTLHNDLSCLFNNMKDVNFYNGSASLDVKLQGKCFIHPLFHLFVSFFLCMLMRPFVHTECVCLRKINVICRSSGRVSGSQTK